MRKAHRVTCPVREKFIIIKCIIRVVIKNGVQVMKNEKGFAFALFAVFLVVALGMAAAENNQTHNATMNKTANETMNKTANETMNKTMSNERIENATINQTTNATNSTMNAFKNAKGEPPEER